jgi:hypothetical protein
MTATIWRDPLKPLRNKIIEGLGTVQIGPVNPFFEKRGVSLFQKLGFQFSNRLRDLVG